MMYQLTFDQENQKRIHAVETSFGPAGKALSQPGRVLIGQGQLMKQSRRGPQPKVFFLFNDVLVYGSIILKGHWHKNQQIILLEDIQLEDLEDGVKMKNQWLIRTPRKSFFVAAASYEEKRSWIEHMEDCRFRLLQSGNRRPGSTFAVTWIPDQAATICMRCYNKFTVTQRRHHCRKCGFVVCSSCSKKRAVVRHIHTTKRLRVCCMCHLSLLSIGETGLDEDGVEGSSEEEEAEEQVEDHDTNKWMDSQMDPWSIYIYLKPEHVRPSSIQHSDMG
ncbi:pleckstrin homology domain-containing family F member 1 [Hippoglossus stenolepis]|uniref:pleckstrin homology domain-containing family F member 1 n=1 Tax=Hippoglossus stenolepis TaxID=195615 RepID=UPI001FAED08E|nr:pleckstrin homology domain-containing family F member 1 [Hippoglossus stenolepis]